MMQSHQAIHIRRLTEQGNLLISSAFSSPRRIAPLGHNTKLDMVMTCRCRAWKLGAAQNLAVFLTPALFGRAVIMV
jgi:hypothetical protein